MTYRCDPTEQSSDCRHLSGRHSRRSDAIKYLATRSFGRDVASLLCSNESEAYCSFRASESPLRDSEVARDQSARNARRWEIHSLAKNRQKPCA
jgi:hypothetical protein